MSEVIDRIMRRGRSAPALPPAAPAPAPGQPAAPAAGPAQTASPAPGPVRPASEADPDGIDPAEEREVRAQRDRLVEKFTVMQSDLGGAFYEMAIRDHVRMDVLTRKAAELQRVDAELLAIERILRIERSGAAGICRNCGAPYAHGVLYCSQCGASLAGGQAAP